MSKKLSTTQAWREIARRFYEDKPRYGLCYETTVLASGDGRISWAQADQMKAATHLFLPDKPYEGCYIGPTRGWTNNARHRDTLRMWAALFLAAMSE